MTAKLQLLWIALAATLSMASAAVRILDQHTDQSTAARDLLLGQMWQSFRPSWSGKVVQFDVYMGSTAPCTPMQGTLVVREGVPASFRDLDNATYTLIQQGVQTSCDGAECVNGDCITWQNFTLTSPVTVDETMVFTFALLNLTTVGSSSMARIGVAPSSLNHGGTASLVTSPKFETRYSQYTFRSWMDRPSGPDTVLQQRPSGSDIDAEDNTGSGSSRISSTTIAGIVVPIIVIAVFVVLVVVVVKVRRNLKHNMQLGSLIEDTDHSVNSPKSAWTIWSGMSVGEQQQHVTNVNVSSAGDNEHDDQFVEFVRTPKTAAADEEAVASARMAASTLSGTNSRNRSRINPTNVSNPTTPARRKLVNVRTESNGLDDSTTWASRSGSLSLLPEHDTMSMTSLVSSGSNKSSGSGYKSETRSLNFRDGDNLSLQPDESSLHDPSLFNDETDI